MALGLFELLDDAADAVVVQPGLAVAQVELAERGDEPAFEATPRGS